jgi:hypothetical protein
MSGMATDIIVSYFKLILVQNQPTSSLVYETSFESTRSFIRRNLRHIYEAHIMKIEVQHEETSDIIELVYHIIEIRKK